MSNAQQVPWLPDLCRLPRLAAMLALAELVVVVIALAPDGLRFWGMDEFLAASAYALWVTLTVSVLLCVSGPRLSRLPMFAGMAVALVMSALVAMAASAMAHVVLSTLFPTDTRPAFWRFLVGSTGITVLIVVLALRYFHAIDRWQAQVSAHARAEADALQARIRPHFLFNSMNMIATLVRRDPVVAERAVLDLSDLFRAALGVGNAPSTLADEVALAEQYMAIEQLRLGERLKVAWDKREPLPWGLPMPRLVLQPLLENAVLHGISRLPEGGLVEVALIADAQRLSIRVRNPAPAAAKQGEPALAGSGHAQRSIGLRLEYAFGARARMVCAQNEGYYDCELSLPLA